MPKGHPGSYDTCKIKGLEEAGLTFRQRAILKARYGIGEPERTLFEIGKSLNLTQERVRQIEAKALCKLQRWVNLKLKLAGAKGLPI